MGFMNVLERVAGWQRQRQEARVADFRDLVCQIADGTEPDPDHVDYVLHDAHKSLDDLKAAVERLEKRRALRAKLDSIPKLTAERQRIEQRINVIQAALDEAERKHDEGFQPLWANLQQIKETILENERGRYELWSTCSDEKLLAELADVTEKLGAARSEATGLRNGVEENRNWAKISRQKAARLSTRSESEEATALAEQREHQADQFAKELPVVEKRIAELERLETALRQRMLEP